MAATPPSPDPVGGSADDALARQGGAPARSRLLAAPPDAAFDRLARLAVALLRAPLALVSLVDRDRAVFAGSVGLPEPWASRRGAPLVETFCRHVVDTAAPLVVADARAHPWLRDTPAIADLGVVAYAGMPLTTADGHILGVLCVMDHQPRAWPAEDMVLLADFAALAVRELELRLALQRLEERERALREREAQLRLVTAQLPTVLWMTDRELRIRSAHGAYLADLGWEAEAYLGRTLYDIVRTPDPALPAIVAHHAALAGESSRYELVGGARTFDVRVEPFRDDDGTVTGCLALAVDVSEAKRVEARLAHQATHDPLTGLANRALFADRLKDALTAAAPDRVAPVAVLVVDLDRFKHVNDTFGHGAGDELLVAVAGRLTHAVRGGDTVARLGGDEFAVVLVPVSDIDEAHTVADRILAAVGQPFRLAGGPAVPVTASIGVALATAGVIPTDLLYEADVALYQAKVAGRAQVTVFDAAMAPSPQMRPHLTD